MSYSLGSKATYLPDILFKPYATTTAIVALKKVQEYALDIVSALKGIQTQLKITIKRFGNRYNRFLKLKHNFNLCTKNT